MVEMSGRGRRRSPGRFVVAAASVLAAVGVGAPATAAPVAPADACHTVKELRFDADAMVVWGMNARVCGDPEDDVEGTVKIYQYNPYLGENLLVAQGRGYAQYTCQGTGYRWYTGPGPRLKIHCS
jgi:hypothetical protein